MKTEDIDKKIGMPDVDEEWAKFERDVIDDETKPRKRVYMGWTVGIAASIALLTGIFLWENGAERKTDSGMELAQTTNVQSSEKNNVSNSEETKDKTTGNNQVETIVDNSRTDNPPSNHISMTTPQSNERETTPPTNDRTEEQTPAIDKRTDNKIFSVVEQQPSFRGGNIALQEFIKQNLRYPSIAQSYGVNGRVIMQVMIDSVGYIHDIKALRHILRYDTLLLNRESESRQIQLKEQIARQLEEECARVIGLMPRWRPMKMNGKAVNTKYYLPFQFQPSETSENASGPSTSGTHQ